MTVQEIANRLVELCRKGEFEKTYEELYDPINIVSIETNDPEPNTIQGMEAILEKAKGFEEKVEEMHSHILSEPLVAGNHFSLSWTMNCTFKGAPGPIEMAEICVYEVQNGKIVKEQFFYAAES